jgi:hypothetical protein
MTENDKPQSQADRFAAAAREAECDEDKAQWEVKLRQISKQKPKAK